MTDITGNSSLLEGKPRGSITLKDIIDRLNAILQAEIMDSVDGLELQSSILTATGIWLDYIGYKIKYPRPLIAPDDTIWFGFDGSNGVGFDQLPFTPGGTNKVGIDDESYRTLLIVRGGQLLTDCSIPSLDAIVQGAFGTGRYIDNGNMTLDVILDDSHPDVIIKALVESGLITKPAGVAINNILIQHLAGTFGFDGSSGVGFDQSPFVKTFDDLI